MKFIHGSEIYRKVLIVLPSLYMSTAIEKGADMKKAAHFFAALAFVASVFGATSEALAKVKKPHKCAGLTGNALARCVAAAVTESVPR